MRRGAVSHCIQMFVPSIEMEVPSICVVDSADPATQLLEPISSLLHKYDHLFDAPKTLPPRRSVDHTIPLVPGAQPVKVRPYKYSPIQKT